MGPRVWGVAGEARRITAFGETISAGIESHRLRTKGSDVCPSTYRSLAHYLIVRHEPRGFEAPHTLFRCAYVKEVMGEQFTPKDFRTWAGTLIAAVKLAELGVTEDLGNAEENVLAAVDDVAKRLGNTRDIARASYISPRIIDLT